MLTRSSRLSGSKITSTLRLAVALAVALAAMISAGHGQEAQPPYQAADHWPLDEPFTPPFDTLVTENLIRPDFGGWYSYPTNGPTVTVGESGSSPVTGRSCYFRGNEGSHLQLFNLNYNTATVTFTAWVKRDGQQLTGASIFRSSTGSRTQLEVGPNNELRYQWNGIGSGFVPSPGLALPDKEWCLVALVATPGGVTLHLRTPSGLNSATHVVAVAPDDFNGTTYAGLLFKGWLDDIRTYRHSLSAANIESLYQQAFHPPTVSLVSPTAGSFVHPLDVEFAAEVTSGGGSIRKVEFFKALQPLGTATSLPYAIRLPALEEDEHQVHAVAEYGDWAYRTASAPISFRSLPPPPPIVTVAAGHIPSRIGPSSGHFVLNRSHPLGMAAISYTLGGTAVLGVDYTITQSSWISLGSGDSPQYFHIYPVAGLPLGEPKTIILTLVSHSSGIAGSPGSATLILGDHITSKSGGEWDEGPIWHGNVPPPVTGTQNNGNDYLVRHTVTSNDPDSNSQALIARSLRVEGALDLARTHSTVAQNASYNLPPLTLADGGRINFRASSGSVNHAVSSAISNTGSTLFLINGGNYSNKVAISGPINGTGTIGVLSNSHGSSVTADLRQLSVNSANNSYIGNWTVTHVGGGDENAALRAGAANALGTGTVAVGARAQLINDVPGGINSLKGVVLESDTSKLVLNQQWNAPLAKLTLNAPNSEVKVGISSNYVGNLSGAGGLISGTTATSLLSINQTVDGTFGGRLVSPLRFEKTGDALLKLSGSVDPLMRYFLTGGGLEFRPTGVTLRTLSQTGGQLFVTMESTATPPLVMEAYNSSTGGITVRSDFTPATGVWYPLLQYKTTLAGRPPVTFTGPAALSTGVIVDYGSGNNSLIKVSFGNDPYTIWTHGFGLEGEAALPTADPDGDRLTNSEELVLGFDPSSAASKLTLTLNSLSESQAVLTLNRVTTSGSFTLESAEHFDGPWETTPLPISAVADNHPIQVVREGNRRFYRVSYQTP